jgi:hypothetical protein
MGRAGGFEHLYAHIGDDGSIWGAILEKAWAKVKGSYAASYEGGLMTNGIRALTGAPVFTYTLEEEDDTSQDFWDGLKAADDLDWLMGVYTVGWRWRNDWELQNHHYYSLISVFELKNSTAELEDFETEYPYYPANHVTSACREAGVDATELEGGYGGDCLHLCNYEDAEHVYDAEGLDNNTNAYCIDGYDYSEKFIMYSPTWELDICQSICVPTGEEAYYVS